MLNELVQIICGGKDVLIALIGLLLSWYTYCTYRVQKAILENPAPITRVNVCNLLYSRESISEQFREQLPYFIVAACFWFICLAKSIIGVFALFSSITSIVITVIVFINNDRIAIRLNQESRTNSSF